LVAAATVVATAAGMMMAAPEEMADAGEAEVDGTEGAIIDAERAALKESCDNGKGVADESDNTGEASTSNSMCH